MGDWELGGQDPSDDCSDVEGARSFQGFLNLKPICEEYVKAGKRLITEGDMEALGSACARALPRHASASGPGGFLLRRAGGQVRDHGPRGADA